MLDISYVLKHGNGWLIYKDAEYYLRYSRLILENQHLKMLVLASMSRASRAENVDYNENIQRTGFMDEFMSLLENEACNVADGVYIENVINKFLPGYFSRRGYTLIENEFAPSFYKFNS